MRMTNWAALSIAAGMSSCSLVVATPAAHVAPQPVAKTDAVAAVATPASATRLLAG